MHLHVLMLGFYSHSQYAKVIASLVPMCSVIVDAQALIIFGKFARPPDTLCACYTKLFEI